MLCCFVAFVGADVMVVVFVGWKFPNSKYASLIPYCIYISTYPGGIPRIFIFIPLYPRYLYYTDIPRILSFTGG